MTHWPPTDSQALAELLELHVPARPRILDCTYGRGRVWGHLPIRQSIIKVDINPELPDLDLVADWRELQRHYARGSIDCLVWDPIHVADVGRTSQFYSRYVAPQNPVKGDSVAHLYPCFLEVAEWLVKPRTGVCLVKLCDQVHSARQQWQVLNFVREAQSRGWTACDYTIVQNATGARKDPKHKAKYHVPQARTGVPGLRQTLLGAPIGCQDARRRLPPGAASSTSAKLSMWWRHSGSRPLCQRHGGMGQRARQVESLLTSFRDGNQGRFLCNLASWL